MEKYNFSDLIKLMEILRGEEGCLWDKKQTHTSLLYYLEEEVKEFSEAVSKNDIENMKEELGDILLQVVFHSQIAKERGNFTIEDVIDNLCKKLIRRHPHVFGNKKMKNEKEIIENWQKIKKMEREKKDDL